MEKEGFVYSFKVTNLERKQVAGILVDVFNEPVEYTGVPKFEYMVGGWTIDRNGLVTSPELSIKETAILLGALSALGYAQAGAEGDATIMLSMEGHNGVTLRNLVNLIWCKDDLLRKALGRTGVIIPADFTQAANAVPVDDIDDFAKIIGDGQLYTGNLFFDFENQRIGFKFFNATLNAEEAIAYVVLCWRLNQQAMQQKFTSIKQKETENDKYSMRCWLLKLGFLGDAYKKERKVLLERLSGHAAFRTVEALKAANDKRRESRV